MLLSRTTLFPLKWWFAKGKEYNCGYNGFRFSQRSPTLLIIWSNLTLQYLYEAESGHLCVNKQLLKCHLIIGDLFLTEFHSNAVETKPLCCLIVVCLWWWRLIKWVNTTQRILWRWDMAAGGLRLQKLQALPIGICFPISHRSILPSLPEAICLPVILLIPSNAH